MSPAGPFDEEGLALLEEFLMSERAPEHCMQLSELDGLLAGIAAGPSPVPMEEWLPVAMDGEPAFASPEERALVLGLLARRLEDTAATLRQEPEAYAPLFWEDDRGEPYAADWAEGFREAIRLRAGDWAPLLEDEEANVLLAPIAALWDAEEPRVDLDPSEQARLQDEATGLVQASVVGIHRYWYRRGRAAGG